MTRRKKPVPDDSPAVPSANGEAAETCNLRIESDLTIYTVIGWKEALLSELERCPAMSIDLTDVSELDTAGLQLLLLANREAQRTGKTLTLVAPSAAVTQVLELCNLGSQFNLQPAQARGEGG